MAAEKTHPIHVGGAQAPAVQFSFPHQLLLYSNFLAVTESKTKKINVFGKNESSDCPRIALSIQVKCF